MSNVIPWEKRVRDDPFKFLKIEAMAAEIADYRALAAGVAAAPVAWAEPSVLERVKAGMIVHGVFGGVKNVYRTVPLFDQAPTPCPECQAREAGEGGSIDSPEFWSLLEAFKVAPQNSATQFAAERALIAHIDARLPRTVVAKDQQ